MKKSVLFILAFINVFATLGAGKGETVQCANLIYGGNNTSRCFSDEFLSDVQRKTAIPTERRFKSVKLSSDDLFKYPFVIITGENQFYFTPAERKNLKKYLQSGGFMLASAGCSNKKFDSSFRREIKRIFGKNKLKAIPMDHIIFRTVNKIKKFDLKHETGKKTLLEGLEINGKIALIYSEQGLNDTAHTSGCCCCGGNEIKNSIEVNVNILVYALLH
jgi:hypothetical protein